MKVLLIGDASNYHHSLSVGLAQLGHQVTVASNGSRWMDTARNIDLSRRKGKVGGALLWLKLQSMMQTDLKGYDVVQISNPIFLELRPKRVRNIFDKLKRRNGSVMLTALGTDTAYVDMCLRENSPLAYNEWRVGDTPTPYCLQHQQRMKLWLTDPLRSHCQYVYENVDGVVSALYEYCLAFDGVMDNERVAYAGIPILLNEMSPQPNATDKLRIMIACHAGREAEKGIDLMLPVVSEFAQENAERVRLDYVSGLPFEQFKQALNKANVIVDQLYAYSPSTTPLMAMAQGKVVVTGGEQQFYDFIEEKELMPIINPNPLAPERLTADLQRLLENPEELQLRSAQGRAFVAKHNAAEVVAKRFTDFWERRLR